jgi:ribosomal protein S18 acetylase RimI-like enzyme
MSAVANLSVVPDVSNVVELTSAKSAVSVVKVEDMVGVNRAISMILSYYTERRGGFENIEIPDWERISRNINDSEPNGGNHRLYIAMIDGQEAGVASLSKQGELGTCWVKPDFRRKGVAQALIRRRVKDGGWFSSVRQDNHASAAALGSFGFVLAVRGKRFDRYVRITEPIQIVGTPVFEDED